MAGKRDLVNQVVEAINSGQLDNLDDTLGEFFVIHDPVDGELDRDGFKQMIARYRAAFPDLRMTSDEVIEAGDRVLHRWTIQGTHEGKLEELPPTHKVVVVHGISLIRFEGDKPAEEFVEWDALGLMRQLGDVGEQPETAP